MAELKEDERDLKRVDIWNIKVNLLGKEGTRSLFRIA